MAGIVTHTQHNDCIGMEGYPIILSKTWVARKWYADRVSPCASMEAFFPIIIPPKPQTPKAPGSVNSMSVNSMGIVSQTARPPNPLITKLLTYRLGWTRSVTFSYNFRKTKILKREVYFSKLKISY